MLQDGDSGFLGLDMRRDPAVVKEGYYTIGEHVECEDGTVKTRPGNIVVPWGDTYQYDSHILQRPVERHEDIVDVIRFSNTADQREYLLIATLTEANLCLPGATAKEIAYPPAYAPAEDARLIQAYDKVFLLGGDNKRPLYWDGDPTNDFIFADTGDLGTYSGGLTGGFERFPNTRIGCYHKNRLWIKGEDPNQVYPSDILSPTDFYVGNEFYVNQGDSDEIRALVPYTENRIICFKSNSIYSLDSLTGTLDNAEINLVSNNFGIVADRSAQVLGPSIIWLDRRGVMMAMLEYDQRLTPDSVPLSEPIDPIIRRINWAYAHRAVSAVHNERYYLAVPLDDNTKNSAVLIYNLKNQAWESVDTYTPSNAADVGDAYDDSFGPQSMSVIAVDGRNTLITTTLTGCVALYRYNRGKPDRMAESTSDLPTWMSVESTGGTVANTKIITTDRAVTSVVQTRGYLAGDMSTKRGAHVDLTVDTFNPKLSIELVSAGPGEGKALLTDKTRDRTKRRDYASSATTSAINNANNEHTNPYLDDYSIHPYNTRASETGSEYPEFYFGDGSTIYDVYVNQMQEFHERFRAYKRCRAPRIKITNTQGTASLKSVFVKEYDRKHKHRREV